MANISRPNMTTTWKKEVKEHPIHNRLESIYEILNKEWAWVDESEPEKRLHLRKIINNTKIGLNSTDIYLLTKEFMDSIDESIIKIESDILKYKKDGNVSHLDNALANIYSNGYYDFVSFPITKKKNHKNDSDRSVDDEVITTLNSLVLEKDKFIQDLDDLDKKIKEIKNSVENTNKENDDLIDSINNEFTTLKESINDEATKKIDELISNSNTKLEELYENLDKSIEAKELQVDESLNKKNEQLSKKLNDFIDKKEKEIEKLHNQINIIKEDAEEKRIGILKLYNLVAEDSVAGGYKETFDKQTKVANDLRIYGIVFIILAIFFVISFFIISIVMSFKQINVSVFSEISNFSIIFLFLSIGYYLTAQSEKHRNLANWAKQMSLEVEAFDPFVSTLSEDKKNELKEALANKIFGTIEKPMLNKTSTVSMPIDATKALLKMMDKLIDKKTI